MFQKNGFLEKIYIWEYNTPLMETIRLDWVWQLNSHKKKKIGATECNQILIEFNEVQQFKMECTQLKFAKKESSWNGTMSYISVTKDGTANKRAKKPLDEDQPLHWSTKILKLSNAILNSYIF